MVSVALLRTDWSTELGGNCFHQHWTSPCMIAFYYVYVSFDELPIIGFRNDFAIEGGSGVGHLECFFVSLPPCSFFRYDILWVSDGEFDGTHWGFYILDFLLRPCCSLRASNVA